MRVLVTGASGFVGGHLCEHLVAEGDLVVGLSASGRWPAPLAHLDQLVRLERGDLANAEEPALADWLQRKRPEVVYHLAAQSNPHASLSDPRGTWALNLGGTLNLLEAINAADLKPRPRVLLVSSGVCYGNPRSEYLPVSEDCPLRPNNPYSASKAAADLLGIQHHLAHATDVMMVRPFNHAGPRQSPTYVLAALALQVAEVEAGRKRTSRSAISTSFAISLMSVMLFVVTASWLITEKQEKYTILGQEVASSSLMRLSVSGASLIVRSRSGSTRHAFVLLIYRFSLPTQANFARPPDGSRSIPLNRLSLICSSSVAKNSATKSSTARLVLQVITLTLPRACPDFVRLL